MSNTEALPDYIIKAMQRTWSLGQTYWQQADSKSYAAHRRSADTHAKYIALLDEVRAALAQPAASGEPVAWLYSVGNQSSVSTNYVPGVRATPLYATAQPAPAPADEIQRLRAAVVAERERCAVLVENTQKQWPGDGLNGHLLAAEIRAAA